MVEMLLVGAALGGALAFLAGVFENEESDAGSASNPNSQVQLAPQIGHIHRYYNKAISGEPPQNALWATVAATTALLLLNFFDATGSGSIVIASAAGAVTAMLLQCAYGSFAHISRTASMKNFKQPLYWDALLVPLPLSMAYLFLSAFTMTLLSFVMHHLLGNPFSVPLIAMFIGFTLGAIGSSTGDVFYGAERLYQQYIFGSGIAISKQGDIDVRGEYGYRNSVDTPYFTLRFGGPITGLTFGMLIFLDALSRSFHFAGSWTFVLIAVMMICILFGITTYVEWYARKRYGPYR